MVDFVRSMKVIILSLSFLGGYLRELLEGSEAQQLGRIFQFSDAVSSALTAHFQALQREEGLEGKGPVTHSCVQVKERLKGTIL